MSDTPAVAPTLGDPPNKTPLDVLRGARALVELPEHWTQDANARDADGNEVPSWDLTACSFCITGAIRRASSSARFRPLSAAVHAMRLAVGDSPPFFNDTPGRTHAEILAAFDKAIASLEQQP